MGGEWTTDTVFTSTCGIADRVGDSPNHPGVGDLGGEALGPTGGVRRPVLPALPPLILRLRTPGAAM